MKGIIKNMNDKKKSQGILNYSGFLYLTEFFAGMGVMAVELGASRLLAPYFSSSQIVWTIIIGTIMIAMACGNVFGGISADKNPDPDILYRRIMIAAVWICAIPFLGKYIILAITGLLVITVNTNLLIWAAFLACMIIFVFPLFLLGTVTPSLVKYTVNNLDSNGRVVGSLGAFNTIGSIIGTFAPTFITIPAVGTAVTFLIFSGILLILGLVYYVTEKKRRLFCLLSVLLFAVFSVLGQWGGFAFWEKNLIYEGESVYNYLKVEDWSDRVILSTNVLFGVQSVKMKSSNLTDMYYDIALAAPVMADVGSKEKSSLLVLGMGTGTYAGQCAKYFPDMAVEGVEIDEKITDLAHRYFDLSASIPVSNYDGRAFLNVNRKKYDVIMVDAYQDITIPFQMSSVEFFTMVRDHLAPGGIMVVNLNMYTDEKGSINEYLLDTIDSVFGQVVTADVPGSSNREVFASRQGDLKELLYGGAESLEDTELVFLMRKIAYGLEIYKGGSHIFTDDKAPVELMGMRAIDDLIRDELGIYKEIFREKGPGGFLEMVN